jgi:tripartite-type tricarboxylate transporter receptor subunit TctC
MKRPLRRLIFAVLLGFAAFSSGSSCAQSEQAQWPSKAITWLVGYPPGGTTDVISRLIARHLETLAGQPVVVENRAGGSGLIAQRVALQAVADGHTLIILPGPILGGMRPEVGKEFTAVALLATGATVLVGPASAAYADIGALLEAIRKNPQRWSYASSGIGTGQHLAGELFNQLAGTSMVHVPYKGGGQAIQDVVSAQVPLAILGIAPVLPQVRAGRLRAYAVTSAGRHPALPDVPTLAESGLKDFDASNWFVLATPARTPEERLTRLNAWVSKILTADDVRDALDKAGLVPGQASPAEATRYIQQDLQKWKSLVARNNLKLD